MAIINKEDILGVCVDGKMLCMNCFDEELQDVNLKDMITLAMIANIASNTIYMCDECGEAIKHGE